MFDVKPASLAFCLPHLFEEARRTPIFPPGTTISDYEALIKNWRFLCIYWNEECLMIISLVEHRIHIYALPDSRGRWCRPNVLRSVMDAAFEGKLFLQTMIDETNLPAIRVAEKIGFRKIYDSMGYRYYFLHKEDRKF